LPRFITETLVNELPYEPNTIKTLAIPTLGYITRLELDLELEVTTDSSNGGTPAEDALARIVKSLRVEVPGGKPYFAVADGRLLKYLNYLEFGRVEEEPLPTAAGVTAKVRAKYYVSLGFEPEDPFDPTVVIPATKLNDLQMVVAWGNDSDLGTGYTVNSGKVKVTVRRIELEEDEEETDIWPEGLNTPTFSSETLDVNSVVSDLGLQTNIPVGNVIRDILILQLDSADNRTDDIVSEVGLVIPATKETPFKMEWKALKISTAKDYGLEAPVKGLAAIDLADVTGIPVGLDTSLMSPGEWKLGFTTVATGGKLVLLYRQLS